MHEDDYGGRKINEERMTPFGKKEGRRLVVKNFLRKWTGKS